MEPVNLMEFEALARQRLSEMAFAYYVSGAEDEVTLRENRDAFQRIKIAYKVLRNVGQRSTGTTVLGHRLTMPVMFAPAAFQQLAHPEGEAATARAAGNVGTIMMLSTLSNVPVEQVVAASSGPVWFQLYVYRDRKVTEAVVRRAEAAGCKALVLTVDAPVLGRRERDIRQKFTLPPDLAVSNLLPGGMKSLSRKSTGSGLAAYFASLLDPGLSWDDVAWLKGLTGLPLIVKGIVRADDALQAVNAGCAGLVVSNHGGRQLDTAPATIEVLALIARAVRSLAGGDRCALLLDGGVRRGTDVLKAVALGADAVLIGRPVLWALAYHGQAGVQQLWRLLWEEFDTAMALAGCRNVGEIGPDLLC